LQGFRHPEGLKVDLIFQIWPQTSSASLLHDASGVWLRVRLYTLVRRLSGDALFYSGCCGGFYDYKFRHL
jgi:hypothetical protein